MAESDHKQQGAQGQGPAEGTQGVREDGASSQQHIQDGHQQTRRTPPGLQTLPSVTNFPPVEHPQQMMGPSGSQPSHSAERFYSQASSTMGQPPTQMRHPQLFMGHIPWQEKLKLKPHQLRLLAAKSFDTSRPNISVKMPVSEIVFKGNIISVEETLLQMFTLLHNVQSEKLTSFSSSVKILLQKEETKLFIEQKIKGEKLIAVLETNDEDVVVYAFNASDVQRAAAMVNASVMEDVVKLSKESSDLLQENKWEEFEKCLMDKHSGILIISPDARRQKVNITGTDNILPGVKQDISDFMQKHTVFTQVVCFQPNRQKFIVTVWLSTLQDMFKNLKENEKVQITLRNTNTELELKGTRRGLKEARVKLEELGRQMVVHAERYSMLAMLKFFKHPDCPQGLELIGSSNKCVLAFHSEPHDLQVKSADSKTAMSGSLQVSQTDVNTKTMAAPKLPASALITPRTINVSIIEGEITQESADVIVNTTTLGMDLWYGAVSSAILAKAGQALQDECKTKYPGGIKFGDIASTQGHGLSCKAIYHLHLPAWSSSSAKQNLSEVVIKCLMEASNTGYTSLVFPALGTGLLEYPPHDTAHIMLEAIDGFQRANPSTSLRDVRIVVYKKDVQLVQVFRQTHGQHVSILVEGAVFNTPVNAKFRIAGLHFVLLQGDILDEEVDIIVAQVDLTRVSKLQQTGTAVTKGYKRKCKPLLHLIVDKFHHDVGGAVTRCLEIAQARHARTIAMPYLTAGMQGNDVAGAFLKAVSKFQKGNQTGLQELRIVFRDKAKLQSFMDALHLQADKISKELEGQLSPRKRRFSRAFLDTGSTSQGSGTSAPLLEVVKDLPMGSQQASSTPPPSTYLFVYAESTNNIPHVLKALQDFVLDKFSLDILEEDTLKHMKPSVIERICDAGRIHGVEVTVQQAEGKIKLLGHNRGIIQVQKHIKDIISQADQQRHREEAEEMIAKMAQWSYLEVTNTGHEFTEYHAPQNKIIEEAFVNKEKVARLKDDTSGNVYIVDFDLMREYLENNKDDFVYVIRRDKTGLDVAGGELPITWLPHSQGENLKVVKLKPSDKEYKEVEQNFKKTLNTNLPTLTANIISRTDATIVAIDRVQNRLLTTHYLAKKAHMDRHNPSGTQNERTLWHGTTKEATASINQDGFNRSYCDKNATALGEGVYFAVNSSYSAQPTYSPPDSQTGNCYIYQCKVLTGCTTRGKAMMRFLPKRVGQTLYDSATDSISNPTMYVIFSDTQAYPEYLITFKKHVCFN